MLCFISVSCRDRRLLLANTPCTTSLYRHVVYIPNIQVGLHTVQHVSKKQNSQFTHGDISLDNNETFWSLLHPQGKPYCHACVVALVSVKCKPLAQAAHLVLLYKLVVCGNSSSVVAQPVLQLCLQEGLSWSVRHVLCKRL